MSDGKLETPRPLPRWMRHMALVVIAMSHLFLLANSQDPLRLNVGDPWSEANGFLETSFTDILDVGPLTEESYRYIHYPPLSEIIYGAVHKYLGFGTIGELRVFAIGFSALAMWLLFLYVRRLYDERVALIATMLWSSNLLWMMYADMIHQAPVMQASAFLALWGLIRALEEPRSRYWVAAWIGCFACFLTSYDYWLLLPVAVLVTVYMKRGNPFRRANWGPVALCASGCVVAIVAKCVFVIGAVGWNEFVRDVHFQFLERSTTAFEQHTEAVIPTLFWRATMVFSPLIWGLVAYLLVRVVRRSTRNKFIADGTWLLVCALLFFKVFSQLAASQMLAMQVALPFYAICSALLLVRLLQGVPLAKYAAIAILFFAPIWSAFWLLRQERSYLDEEGFRQVRAYLDQHDKGDWLMCNLMADGPIQAYLGRHYWPASSSDFVTQYHLVAIDMMDRFARDDFYLLFFTDPHTRMIDKSLWPITVPEKEWRVMGAHLFWAKKAERMVRDYDAAILRNLLEVNATVVLHRPQFDLYRVTRDGVMRAIETHVPDRPFIDLGAWTSQRHMLPGWSGQQWNQEQVIGGATIVGQAICPWWGTQWCRTVLTKRGMSARGQIRKPEGKLLIRATNACDADLIVKLLKPTAISIAVNDTPLTAATDDRTLRAHVPRSRLREGLNVIALSYVLATTEDEAAARNLPPFVTSVELRQACRP
jgi:hypothetical protein